MTQYIDGIAEIPQSRCVVSEDFRTLTIPAKERTLGCVGDDETRRVWFDMPLSNDGISLRGFALSIHYVNAAGNSNRYDVATAYVVDNRVIFAWLVQRGAYEAAGLVNMSIKMRALDGTNVLDEFNSTTAPFTVKPAQDYDEQPQPEQVDYIGAFIEQQSARIDAKIALTDEAIADAQEATAEATTAAQTANASAAAADEATAQATTAAANANQAATDIREAAERGDFDGEKGEKGDPGEKGETGATGAPGKDGADGYSPTVTTEQTATGATITITDKDGVHTATIANGERGPQGDKGDPGELLDGSVTYDKLYQPLAEAIMLKGSDSSKIVTTDDAAELPLYSLTIHGKSVQDGTPTPDNPVEIQTVKTANLFDSSLIVSPNQNFKPIHIEVSNGSYTASSSCPLDSGAANIFIAAGYKENASGMSTSINGVYLGHQRTITVTDGNITVFYRKWDVLNPADYENMLAAGTQAEPYVPYGSYIGVVCGETVAPIDLQGHELAGLPDGTSDILDVVRTGAIEVAQNVGVVTLDGSEQWAEEGTTKRFYFPLHTLKGAPDYRQTMLCDTIPVNANYTVQQLGISGYTSNPATTQNWVYIYNADVSDVNEFIMWLQAHPMKVFYKTNAPTTYTLPSITPPTPIDGGTVRVVANVTPEIDCTWIKDATKAHGDIATTDASIAVVESTVATSNHAVGSYFVVDNQLYKATRAIATGETIAPGTNCTPTTVMAELVALTS